MLQSCGDEDSAREQLHAAVLQPFLDRVWQGENKEGAGAGEREGTTASRTLLQMSMAEAACQSIATSIINHADFQQMVMDKAVDRDVRENALLLLLLLPPLRFFLLLPIVYLCFFLLFLFFLSFHLKIVQVVEW